MHAKNALVVVRVGESARQSVRETRAEFVLQVGDLVEGLCGSEKLAVSQNTEALAFIDRQKLGVPFLFTKGNHDVTGDGETVRVTMYTGISRKVYRTIDLTKLLES